MGVRVLDDSLLFVAGRFCLDFVNTSCFRLGAPLELLGDEEDLARWLDSAHAVHGTATGVGPGSVKRAVALRKSLLAVVEAVLQGQPPALEELNAALRANPAYPVIAPGEKGFTYSMQAVAKEDAWLSEIVRDAADMLYRDDLSLLRRCECETCVRVFLDTSKNHKRRWCVEKCGSRVKAARYYRRKKGVREIGR